MSVTWLRLEIICNLRNKNGKVDTGKSAAHDGTIRHGRTPRKNGSSHICVTIRFPGEPLLYRHPVAIEQFNLQVKLLFPMRHLMPRTRLPDPSLAPVATDLMLAIGQLVRRLRTETDPGELNLSEASVLARLDRNGPRTTADLARAESMRPQSMKAILASLEEEGCVERRPHPTDGRQILFVLTPKGIEERRRRTAAKREWLVEALAKLDRAEIQALAAAIPLIGRLGDI